jgi:hypothetical protein
MARERKKVYRDQYRYVLLHIYSRDLDPEVVTKTLKLEPTWSARRGTVSTRTGRSIRHVQGTWSIATQLRRNASLEKHIRNVWDQIRPRKAALKRILKDTKGILIVSVRPHPDLVNPEYVFSAEVLENFLRLGIDLKFSVVDPHNLAAICAKPSAEN